MTAIKDTFGLPALEDELTIDEGRRPKPYLDTMGFTTIAVGRNLTSRGMSDDEIDLFFANDVVVACKALDAGLPWWRTLPPAQQRVMLNLCFNMGWPKFSQFVKFFAAMKGFAWVQAGEELRNSLWFGQVASRGQRMITRLVGIGSDRPMA